MKIKKVIGLMGIVGAVLVGCSQEIDEEPLSFSDLAEPTFTNVSVHDPSVIKVDDTYYVFGSHLASAKSTDLMNWTQLSTSVNDAGQIFGDITTQ